MGLRTGDGIPLKHFLEQQEAPHPGKRELLDELVRQELIVIRDDFLKPTRKGLAVADRLALIL
jgi:hypothetical protein